MIINDDSEAVPTITNDEAPRSSIQIPRWYGLRFKSDEVLRIWPNDDGNAEADPYRTGGQGRSSMVHYIKAEFERRHGKGLVESTLAAEARVLLEWAKVKHSKGPIPTLKTIENQIRSRYRKLSKNPTK